jgi:DNA-binding GntR family transcriptional regulator
VSRNGCRQLGAMLQRIEIGQALIDQVHDRLVAAIADGTLKPGERLTQGAVADRLGVSRQPVSHALQILKRRGLAVEAGRRGLVVAPVDGARILDLYRVRAALDGLAATLAAERVRDGAAPAAEIEQLRALVSRGSAFGPSTPITALIDADVAFHSGLHRVSGSAAIVETVAEQWPHFRRSMGIVLADPAIRRRIWTEHADILERVLAGDPRGAETAARHHTERAGEETGRTLRDLSPAA